MFDLDMLFSRYWCELVFDGRNKEFGGFELRQRYAKNTAIALFMAVTIFVLAMVSPHIVNLISEATADDELKIVDVTTLEAPPPIDKDEPPPPPVEPPPPLKTTIKFTPPVIVKDEEVTEEPPPTQEELKEVEAGATTQEGDSDGVDLSLLEGSGNEIVDDKPEAPLSFVEQMPEFPGGEKALLAYISSNTKYPQLARENGIQGKVYVQFVVAADGNVKDPKVVRGIGGGCDEEAIRVVKTLPPWKAGKQGGRAVPVYYNLPIIFTLK